MSVLTAEQSELRTQLAQRWAHFYYDPEVPLTALSEEEIRHSYEVADEFLPMFDALREQIATAERRATDALASLKWAVYALEHATGVEVHWLKHVAREPYEKALAVIAAGPEGRKG